LLNSLSFYQNPPPKSLGIEWCMENIFPLIEKHSASIPDLLSTMTEHFADQIAKVLNENAIQNVLVTGGGAYNQYLMERLQSKTASRLSLPEKDLIDSNEAWVFAFMGLKRLENSTYGLSSVTRAKKDHSSGIFVA